jgi:hypothetical protein
MLATTSLEWRAKIWDEQESLDYGKVMRTNE